MLIRGKTLEEVEAYFIHKSDGPVTLKHIADNEGKSVYRLQYHEIRYSQRTWSNKNYLETSWLIVRGDMVEWSVDKKRIAMHRIGIVKAPKPERVIRDQEAYDFDQQLCKDAREFGKPGGWCGVRAFCNLTKSSFAKGKVICAEHGWTASRGMRTRALIDALEKEGYVCERVTDKIRKHSKTIKTFEREGWRENYLLHTHDHFVSSVNGVITDWTAGRNHVITGAWKVYKKK